MSKGKLDELYKKVWRDILNKWVKLRMLLIPSEGSLTENRYMAYITEDKLGLQKFPLTGNPFDSIALFSHPDGVFLFIYRND